MTTTRYEVPANSIKVGDVITRNTTYGEHRLTVETVEIGEAMTLALGLGHFISYEATVHPTPRSQAFGNSEMVSVIRTPTELGHKGRSWTGR